MRKQLTKVLFIIITAITFTILVLYLPLLINTKKLWQLSKKYTASIFTPEAFSDQDTNQLVKNWQNCQKNWQKIVMISQILPLPLKTKTELKNWQTKLNELNIVFNWLFFEEESVIVLLQNSQELRATGGFMGSYAKINLKRGLINDLYFNDIYEPDGKFNPTKESNPPQTPQPVAQYLTQSQNWRLPDSNWHPDFTQSARNILWFFEQCGEDKADALIAINLSLAEEILVLTGPVYLTDFQTEVNQHNLAEVARMEREDFFPGTKQKKHFFSLLFNQLKFKLTELSANDKLKLLTLIQKNLATKNIQIFTKDTALEQLLQKYHYTGTINHPQPLTQTTNNPLVIPPAYLMLVESNVGINKANAQVDRQVTLMINGTKIQLTINFQNNNQSPTKGMVHNRFIDQAEHLSYVNYQRVLLTPEASVSAIKIDNKLVTSVEEDMIKNYLGENFKEYGFLVTVPEQKRVSLELTIEYPQLVTQLYLQKQAGLPPVPYIIEYNNHQQNLILEKDIIFDLNN